MVYIVMTFSADIHHSSILAGSLSKGPSEYLLMMALKISVLMTDLAEAYHPITSFLYVMASSSVRKARPFLT